MRRSALQQATRLLRRAITAECSNSATAACDCRAAQHPPVWSAHAQAQAHSFLQARGAKKSAQCFASPSRLSGKVADLMACRGQVCGGRGRRCSPGGWGPQSHREVRSKDWLLILADAGCDTSSCRAMASSLERLQSVLATVRTGRASTGEALRAPALWQAGSL